MSEKTEVTRLAAAALAVREALKQLDGEGEIDANEMGLVVRISAPTAVARTVERVIADVERRYGISISIDWR